MLSDKDSKLKNHHNSKSQPPSHGGPQRPQPTNNQQNSTFGRVKTHDDSGNISQYHNIPSAGPKVG